MALADKYIDPFTDFGFKKLFGTELNKDLLIDFLNQILPSHHQISELSYTPTEQLGSTPADRKAIFDLYCTSVTGDKFIVEMQKAKQNYFKDRSVYYATFPVQEQAQQGNWDFKLAAVYTVGILDFVFAEDKDDTEVKHVVQLKDQQCRLFYDKLTFIYLEMPKFTKTESELETRYDKWLYVLKHLPRLQNRPIQLQERVFQKLFETAELARFDKEERQQYEQSLKYYRDLKNVIDTSFMEGKAAGIMEGMTERNREVAKSALAEGLSVPVIARLTGLTEADIEKLKSE